MTGQVAGSQYLMQKGFDSLKGDGQTDFRAGHHGIDAHLDQDQAATDRVGDAHKVRIQLL